MKIGLTLSTLLFTSGLMVAPSSAATYTFQQIDPFKVNGVGGFVQALGFNDFGQIVGNTTAGSSFDVAGFVYNSLTNQTTFTRNVLPTSINDLGVYYGAYTGPDPLAGSAVANNSYLDAYISTYGALRIPYLIPGYYPGYGSINNFGFVAGPNFTIANGIVNYASPGYSAVNDLFQTLPFGGQNGQSGVSINNSGDVVGNGGGAFVIINGVRQAFTTPYDAAYGPTTLTSINNLGQVLGYNGQFSFIATPVSEPSSLLSLAVALGSLIGATFLRNRQCHKRVF